MGAWRIKEKQRFCASPPAHMRQSWSEFQVKDGRKILYRGDTYDDAVRFIQNEYVRAILDGKTFSTYGVELDMESLRTRANSIKRMRGIPT